MRWFILLMLLAASDAWASIGDVRQQKGEGTIQRKAGETVTSTTGLGIESLDTVRTKIGRISIQFVDDTRVDITSAASETFTLTVNAAGADADIDISNASGTVGNTSSYTQTGDGAVINMSQSGIYDNTIDVTTSGDNATIDITQTD